MDQCSAWQADSLWGNEEISRLLWKRNSFPCLVALLDPIMSEVNAGHTVRFCFFEIHFNIISPIYAQAPQVVSFFAGFLLNSELLYCD
jgi:hypothetical protein